MWHKKLLSRQNRVGCQIVFCVEIRDVSTAISPLNVGHEFMREKPKHLLGISVEVFGYVEGNAKTEMVTSFGSCRERIRFFQRVKRLHAEVSQGWDAVGAVLG